MKHALKLLDDHTLILTIPKGTRVDRVLVGEMGMKTGTMYLPEQATFRNLNDLHYAYDVGLITLDQYLNERDKLERGDQMGDVAIALILGFVVGEMTTVLALWALWRWKGDEEDD